MACIIKPNIRAGREGGSYAMEQMMRNAVRYRHNPMYAEAYEAMRRTYEFWKLYDHLEHSSMLGIFSRLYWEESHYADTQVKLSIDLGVGERTLLRYRKQFVEAFLYNLEEVSREMRAGSANRLASGGR